MITLLVVWSVSSCAGYPSGPRAPQAGEDMYEVEEDGFLSVSPKEGILVNDKAREGTEIKLLTTKEIETEAGGQIVLEEDGSFTYEPKPDFFGMDHAKYTVKNDKGKTSDGRISIDVKPVNDPPRPVDDRQQIASDQPTAIDVLANDKEPDGDSLRIISISRPNSGSAAINQARTILFTPRANHSGDVSFSYRAADPSGEWGEAWVFLTVIDPYSSIRLEPDSITVVEDGSVTLPLGELLINDTDVNGTPLAIIDIGQGQNGLVERNLVDDTFTYTPHPDFSGSDSFTYTVQSRSGSTASSTVTVTVEPENDPPTISPILDQTATAGTRVGPIPFTIEDPDTPFNEIEDRVEVTQSSPEGVVPNNRIRISGENSNRAIWINLSNSELSGSAIVTVYVSDGQEESSESFMLTVTSPLPPDTDDDTATGTDAPTNTETETDTDTATETETDSGTVSDTRTNTNTRTDTDTESTPDATTATGTRQDSDGGEETPIPETQN